MNRRQLLDQAQNIVTKDRDEQYGDPEDSFAQIAAFWGIYLDTNIDSDDVGMMMMLLKIARQSHKPKDDNLIDIAGYAACVAEILHRPNTNQEEFVSGIPVSELPTVRDLPTVGS